MKKLELFQRALITLAMMLTIHIHIKLHFICLQAVKARAKVEEDQYSMEKKIPLLNSFSNGSLGDVRQRVAGAVATQ